MHRPLLLLLIPGIACADVIHKVKTTTELLGTSETTCTRYCSGDRSAEQSTARWTSGLMKTLKGGKSVESVAITRLDRELVWTLDPAKKRYTEMTFAEFREQMKQDEEEMKKAEAGEAEEGEAEEAEAPGEEEYEWTLEDKSDPQPKTINGFPCSNVKLVATGVHKEEPRDKIWITIDQWNCPDLPGIKEMEDFNRRYLEALGVDEFAFTKGLMSFVEAYKKQFEKMAEGSAKAPGERVVSTIEVRRNQHVGPSAKEVAKEIAAEEITGKLPFGVKKKPKKEEERWEEKVKFRSATELLEASTDPIDSARFEIPEGYKKK